MTAQLLDLTPTCPTRTARFAWYAEVARWAPSKHNTQPWRFVVDDTALEVWSDPARALPDTDPHRRELVLACGAAVHLACVAARSLGIRPGVHLLPEGLGGPVARITEVGQRASTELERRLLAAVPQRRTDRGPLDGEALPPGLRFGLQDAAVDEGAVLRLVTTPGDRATLVALVERADRVLARRGVLDAELARWLRDPGDDRGDGVPTDHTRGAAASYRAELVQRDFGAPGTPAAQDRPGRDAPVLGVLCTPGDTPADWLRAGAALASILLTTTAAGAAASYLNQPVEDVPSRVLLREQLDLPGVPQLVLRLGIGGPVTPTARRDHAELVVPR